MENRVQEICEACTNEMQEWRLCPVCVLLRCPKCYHIKRDMQRCNAHAREHAWGGSGLFDKFRIALTTKRLSALLPDKKPLKILEIGFGSGRMLTKFLEKGHEVSGVDAEMLEIEVGDRLNKEGTLYRDNFENIDLQKNEFDVIYGIHVIEHVENPEIVFRKCYESVRDDGIVYFLTPNSESKGLTVFKDAWWNLEDPTHIRFFSSDSVKTMMGKAGFENVQTGIPVWDSLTLEINSMIRLFSKNSGTHGVFAGAATKLIDILLLPSALVARSIYPAFSPTLEIIARKSK